MSATAICYNPRRWGTLSACPILRSQSGTCFACTPQGSARFDPFCLKYIVSYLSGTVRYTAAFIGTPMEWSAKQCQTDQPFGSWADDLANAFVHLTRHKTTSIRSQ